MTFIYVFLGLWFAYNVYADLKADAEIAAIYDETNSSELSDGNK